MKFDDLPFIRHFQVINRRRDGLDILDHEREQACFAEAHEVQLTRGRILTYAIETERLIEDICGAYFVPRDLELRQRFLAIVMTQEFCSFRAKKRILQDITRILEITPPPKLNILDKLMELRNDFAHGKILVDWQTLRPLIEHSAGKRDDAYKMAHKFCELYLQARQLLVQLGSSVVGRCGALVPDHANNHAGPFVDDSV
jgi:hypothetical protein